MYIVHVESKDWLSVKRVCKEFLKISLLQHVSIFINPSVQNECTCCAQGCLHLLITLVVLGM